MAQARHFLVNAYNATSQPTDPVNGYSVHIASTGAAGTFADYPGYIATYNSVFGWTYEYPKVADRMTQIAGSEQTFFFTPQGPSPASTWVSKSNLYSYKSNTQDLTTSYAAVDDWEPADPYSTASTFGAFTWSTTDGVLSLSRTVYGSLELIWCVHVQQTASGNLNTYTVKAQKDAGGTGSWVDMDGGFAGGSTYSDTNLFHASATICVQDAAAQEDDEYRLVAQVESDSADNLLTITSASLSAKEISPW